MLKDKISKDDFVEYIKRSQEVGKFVHQVYEASNRTIDIISLEDELTKPFRILEKNFFDKIELEYISWFLYEYKEGCMKIWKAGTDKEIVLAELNTADDLWEWLNREEK